MSDKPQPPQAQPQAPTQTASKKKSRTGRVVIFVAIVLIIGLLLPVSNLFVAPSMSAALARTAETHPDFAPAAALLNDNCMDCHSAGAKLPFYANFPIARGLVRADMDKGRRYADMPEELAAEPGAPVSEVGLAKLEYVIDNGSMPPGRYLALHWNRGLNVAQKADIRRAIQTIREKHYQTPGVSDRFAPHALQPLPRGVTVNEAKVALGDQMYHDVRLSADDTLSCASCHGLDMGGCDQVAVSTGIGGARGPINSPTVYNAVFNVKQFWDGRAADLKDQASGPVHNPIEMGSNWKQVLEKLEKDPAVVAAFEALYDDGLTGDNIADAIAEFEKSLVTPNSRFDQYLRGDDNALDKNELAGLSLFGENACANCHVGRALGGQSFELMGRARDYFADRGSVTDVDLGRYNVTQDDDDRHRFKVPVLHNIEHTFPYFHDAGAKTLEEAVNTMARYQGYGAYTAAETEQVVAFLKTLTGVYNGKPL